MANKLKGEVAFTVADEAGAETAYTLVYSIDALCVLEERLNLGIAEIGAQMGAVMRLTFLRTLFWAGLREHHKDLSEKAAGELILDVGAEEVGELITRAFTAAFPQKEAAGKAPAGPRKAPSA